MSQRVKSVIKPQLELTLALIKPEICKIPNDLNAIRKLIKINGFYFIRSVVKRMPESEAHRFYIEHKDKFFFWRLVSFMSSGVISAHIIARNNAINHWRKMMGSTKVYKTRHEEPHSIRGRYGLTDTRNATHGSDSIESSNREIQFFFPDFNTDKWLREEEPHFRDGKNIQFSANEWLHKIVYLNKLEN